MTRRRFAIVFVLFSLALAGCGDRNRGYATSAVDARLAGIDKRWSAQGTEWVEAELRRLLDDEPKHPRANLYLAYVLARKNDPKSAGDLERALKRANAKTADPDTRLQAMRMQARERLEKKDWAGAQALAEKIVADSTADQWPQEAQARAAQMARGIRAQIVLASEPSSARRGKLEALLSEQPDDVALVLTFTGFLIASDDPAAALQRLRPLANKLSQETSWQTFSLHLQLANVCQRLGRTDEAAASVARVRQIGATLGMKPADIDQQLGIKTANPS
jgi:predicted Zn-dependent protease